MARRPVAGAVRPGDLITTRGKGLGSALIRFGAALGDKPNLVNHVAIVHHTDKAGTTWCVEGRPGGVGWRDATAYLASRWTISNADQPKNDRQRKTVCEGAVKMLGTDYDWAAIAADAGDPFGLGGLWQLRWGKAGVPGQVVCSSFAAYLYAKAGLGHPEGERRVAPADWLALWIQRGWAARPVKTERAPHERTD
jgi:hypothetical protein